MLAKTEPAERPELPPAPEKRRTVTLTNARPVTILESEWPVIAEGSYQDDDGDRACVFTKVNFRVRCEHRPFVHEPRHLIHGKFDYWDEIHTDGQLVRVGRLLNSWDVSVEKALLEVGQEMKERVRDPLHKWVTLALDRCFAKLGAQVL